MNVVRTQLHTGALEGMIISHVFKPSGWL